MRQYRSKETGEPRLWFEPGEIDELMEIELNAAGAYPTFREPVVDVERFIERHLDVRLEQYADLDVAVLGKVEFGPGEKPIIYINRYLTQCAVDDESAARWLRSKWRMTMAHEATHVILHRRLYPSDGRQSMLFGDGDSESAIGARRSYRLLDMNLKAPGRGDWREVQANQGMAAILMPKTLFLAKMEERRARLHIASGALAKGGPEARAVARALSRVFDVSVQSAAIRLEELGQYENPGQVRLL